MNWKREIGILMWITVVFIAVFFMPLNNLRFNEAIFASLDLSKWYAREHVILCLIPAFFIAGVIAVFLSQASVLKFFGANTKKWISYSVASVSGTILAVCSCTVLPLFSSIHKRGAGLGPAVAFLYSGPAINILAIILTARVLGWEMGLARVIGAVLFSIIIGLIMSIIYQKEEREKAEEQMSFTDLPEKRPMWQTTFHFFTLVIILVFANWGKPGNDVSEGFWYILWAYKWHITSFFGGILAISLIYILKIRWWHVLLATGVTALTGFMSSNSMMTILIAIAGIIIIALIDKRDPDNREWILSAWDFAKQIMPLLAVGVVLAGFLLGSTHDEIRIEGIIPNEWIITLVGNNSIYSNLFSSVVGAFMYFATLTEVPILQGLMAAGMSKGPALALLLAGPSLSLPNILVIRSVMGNQKTIIYVALVIIMATISGLTYGLI